MDIYIYMYKSYQNTYEDAIHQASDSEVSDSPCSL